MRMRKNRSLKFSMKKLSCFILSMVLIISFSVMSVPLTVSAQTNELSDTNISSTQLENTLSDSANFTVEQVADELFGDVNIKSSEYLYNLDDSADYIYVEFDDGYAVFLKDTMELLEYSAQGKLNYPKIETTKYYAGPSFYMFKDNNYFVDVASQEYLYISKESAQTYANEVRKALLSNYEARDISNSVQFDYSILEKEAVSEVQSNIISSEEQYVGEKPKLDTSSLIRLTDGTFIPNYRYFLLDPDHGNNTTGTCGAVAAQLLLSYHNYYSDRRIIANNYLNGGTSNPEANPNLCNDPMRMTSATLGTRGYNENGSDDSNSYFHYVVENIPKSATTSQVKNGLKDILSDRNDEISGTINYTVGSKTGGWFFGLLSVNSSGIISELDSGRPVILLMQESLGGSDHYVVAYGYNNYTYPNSSDTYLGYITHFGWGSGYLNIWVNSAWCYSYITLNIEHTHNYYTVGTISGTNRTEYKCSTCGHRTDAAINMTARDRYVERVATIPQNGYVYKDYYVIFATAGNKLFQTFGTKDAKLYLFDTKNKQLAYNDDAGRGLNSMFNYTVEANKPYILRVKFYSDSTTGDVKVGITPSSVVYSTYEDIWNSNSSNVTFYFSTSLNATRVMTFTPTESGTYTFKTGYEDETRVDTYLYVVDPYTTNACLYNDDGAGDLQALITMDLVAGRTYFMVVSTYDITSTTGRLWLSVNKTS